MSCELGIDEVYPTQALSLIWTHHVCVVLLLLFRVLIVTILPVIISFRSQNLVNDGLADLLHGNNVEASSERDCAYLQEFVRSWMLTAESVQPDARFLGTNVFLLWARILPIRCDFQGDYGVVTMCGDSGNAQRAEACRLWGETSGDLNNLDFGNLTYYFADKMGVRVGGIQEINRCYPDDTNCLFETQVLFNDNFTVSFT